LTPESQNYLQIKHQQNLSDLVISTTQTQILEKRRAQEIGKLFVYKFSTYRFYQKGGVNVLQSSG